MLIKSYAASIQKLGNLPIENEDVYSPVIQNGLVVSHDKYAVTLADGATQSSFSKQFATYLVDNFAHSNPGRDLNGPVQTSREQWENFVNGIDLPWHAQEKRKEGAYSTLLHLSITQAQSDHDHLSGKWKAISVGDTCLFQFRKESVVCLLPLKHSSQFTNTPALIGSTNGKMLSSHECAAAGDWLRGDDFFLMTDALAKWCMQYVEMGKSPVYHLKDKLAKNTFDTWIRSLRNKGELKNDDTTLIWIKVL